MFNLEAGSKSISSVLSSPKANPSQLAIIFRRFLKPVVGLKRDLKSRRRVDQSGLNKGQDDQMRTQVKKILEQKGQGLILMVRG